MASTTASAGEAKQHVSPNGGYGWVVVAGSFLCHFTILGSQYSAGVFIRALTQELGIEQGLASWVTSVAVAMMLGGGLVTGTLVDVFGPRIVGLAGAVLTALGMLLTSFSTSLWQAVFCYGVISGAGFSCGLVSSTVVLAPYFSKRTATAVGLAVAGSGVGTLALSSGATALVLLGGYQLAFRAMALLALLAMGLASAAYVPAEAVRWADCQEGPVPPLPCCASRSAQPGAADPETPTPTPAHPPEPTGIELSGIDSSRIELPPTGIESRTASWAALAPAEPHRPRHFWCPSRAACWIGSDCRRVQLGRFGWACCPAAGTQRGDSGGDLASPAREEDAPSVVKLWQTPQFAMFALSTAVAVFGYFVPFSHLVAFLEDERGFSPSEAGLFMSTIGITSLAGRIFLSRLADIQWMPPVVLVAASMLLMGVPTMLLPLTYGTGWLYLYAVIFGIASGTFVAINPVATLVIVGPRAMSLGFGQVFAAQGIPALLGPPLTGWMRDETGTFTASWLVAGGVMIVAPLLLLAAGCRSRITGPVALGRPTLQKPAESAPRAPISASVDDPEIDDQLQ